MRLGDLDALEAELVQDYAYAAARMVAKAPTIDAVPVVRCKDCEHYNRPANWPLEYTKGRCFLDVLERRIHPDDFCSYGERKDGEG